MNKEETSVIPRTAFTPPNTPPKKWTVGEDVGFTCANLRSLSDYLLETAEEIERRFEEINRKLGKRV